MLWIGQGYYSREVFLQHHETPYLTKYIISLDSHTIFLICQASMQQLCSPSYQAGIKTTIPSACACYIPNAHMSKWEYNLRRKLLQHCRPESNCVDLMETMSHKHIVPVQYAHAKCFRSAFREPNCWSHLWNVHRTISYCMHSPV